MVPSTTDAQIPSALPVLPGVVLAGQYGLTDSEPRSRGDTLGACVLPRGRVALLVADVVGHGVGAALAAAQIRAVIWSSLGAGDSLATAVERLDRYAEHHSDLTTAALGVAVLGLEDGTLEYAAAGLLPPVVLSPHQPPRLVGASTMRPLGTRGTTHVQRTSLGSDDVVVLCTNGVVGTSQTGSGLVTDQAVLRAARALDESVDRGSAPPRRADDVGHELLATHVATHVPYDDAVVLVAQRMRAPEPFTLSLTADTLDVREIRDRLSAWLESFGAALGDHISLGHAVVELASNAARHAYRDTAVAARPIEIEAILDHTGAAVATVTDRGHWLEPGSRHGRGLTMAGGLVDSIDVRRSAGGTQVEVCSRLGRPVQIWQAETRWPARSAHALSAELDLVASRGSLKASGCLDEASAELFHEALLESTCAGTLGAAVDLSDLTHLSSPGVQSLFEYMERSNRSGVRLRVVAAKATPARQILDLVGMPAEP